jgi:ElaB/YqjD/DUF883 family membrane-anchored ribosome-binding protein
MHPQKNSSPTLKCLKTDVQELVRATATESGEQLAAARNRVQSALASASDTVLMQGRQAAEMTDRYIRENSWTAVGVSAAIGFFIGLLVGGANTGKTRAGGIARSVPPASIESGNRFRGLKPARIGGAYRNVIEGGSPPSSTRSYRNSSAPTAFQPWVSMSSSNSSMSAIRSGE